MPHELLKFNLNVSSYAHYTLYVYSNVNSLPGTPASLVDVVIIVVVGIPKHVLLELTTVTL